MRFIKLAVISIVSLIAIITLISLLLPSAVVVTRGVNINAPASTVYASISRLSSWKGWMANRDTLPITISADGNTLTMGKTEVRITSVKSDRVETLWRVNNGTPLQGVIVVSKQLNAQGSLVQWQFVQQLKWYPWEKFSGAITDKVLSPFMEQSLANLKANIEKQ